MDDTTTETGIESVRAEAVPIGSRGLKNMGGVISEEYQKELRTLRQRVAVYSEMANDPYLGAALNVLETLMAGIEYRIQPKKGNEGSPRAINEAEFVSWALRGMETSWEDFMSELLTMLTHGFAAMERTFKIHQPPERWRPVEGASNTSVLDKERWAGRVVFADIALRPAETVWEWVYDGDRLVALKQQLTATQVQDTTPTIPMERVYLFRTVSIKNNPEGRSILRRAYIPYVREKHHRDLEAIGHERDATGTPIVRVPKEIMSAEAGTTAYTRKQAAQNIAKRMKTGTEVGVVLSSEVHEESKTPLYDVSLLKSPGERQFDAGPIIERCNREKLFATGTDMILLGHEKTGALNEGGNGSEKRDILNGGINAMAERIAEVFNRQAIKELCDLNGIPEEVRPEMKPQRLQREITLSEFVKAIADLAGAGFDVADDATENEARARLRLPLKEGVEEI